MSTSFFLNETSKRSLLANLTSCTVLRPHHFIAEGLENVHFPWLEAPATVANMLV